MRKMPVNAHAENLIGIMSCVSIEKLKKKTDQNTQQARAAFAARQFLEKQCSADVMFAADNSKKKNVT